MRVMHALWPTELYARNYKLVEDVSAIELIAQLWARLDWNPEVQPTVDYGAGQRPMGTEGIEPSTYCL